MMKRLLTIALVALLFGLVAPHEAYAGQPPLQIDVCAPGFQPWDYTAKVVRCMENTIGAAVAAMLNAVSIYMKPVVGLIFTLGVAVMGIRVLSGEHQMTAKLATFSIKMGLIMLFSFNLGGFANTFFAIEQQLITMVSGGFSPWAIIDRLLGKLLGFGPAIAMVQGILGMVSAALFSGSTGTIVFGAGIMAILGVLRFVFDIVYTYITAMILLGFLLILSPLLIPLALFVWTERYFKKWLDIVFSVMLTPILLFAFLSMFLLIFSPLIADVFKIMGFPCGNPFDLTTCALPDFSSFWKMNRPEYAWMMANDPNVSKGLVAAAETAGGREGPIQQIPPVQPFMNSMMKTATNASLFNPPGIHFGANHVGIMQNLTFAFITLWIFSALMRSMMETIPGVASSIAGVIVSVPLYNVPMQQRISEGMNNAAVGGGALVGGAIAGSGAAAIAKNLGMKKEGQGMIGQMGGMLGGLAGSMMGKKM